MADKDVLKPALWTARPVEETIAVYADWAATYDAEVTARGYHTPARIADAVAGIADSGTLILDFGCGTGLSGMALTQKGFTNLHGTDVTAEMLDRAAATGLYGKTWLSDPGEMSFGRGAYPVIVAVGVVSLGAAPAEVLGQLVAKLLTGQHLALSYNAPTLDDPAYTDALTAEISAGRVEVVFRENGPHLDDVGMTSDVIVLRRL